jgi:hypothetical protein
MLLLDGSLNMNYEPSTMNLLNLNSHIQNVPG